MRFPLAFLVMVLGASSALSADSKTFGAPKIGNMRLDWCRTWSAQCGEPAATAWCKTMGFSKAVDFDQDPGIGSTAPTRSIGSGAVCDQDNCDGFSFITCGNVAGGGGYVPINPQNVRPYPISPPIQPNRPPPVQSSERDFRKPKIDGVRVDLCYSGNTGCGQRAADAFCDYMDYDEAVDYESAPGYGFLKRTYVIGTRQVTVNPVSNAFVRIRCRR